MELSTLGLTETESLVYTALLNEGLSPASKIIRRLQLHRATVYDVLERLAEKGVVSSIIKDGKRYYEASHPEKFIDLIEEEKKALADKEDLTRKIVAELNKIKLNRPSSSVQILSGKEGLKVLMQELLKVKEFLVMGGEIRFKDYLPIYTIHWGKEREQKKVYGRILINKDISNLWPYNKYKTLPPERKFPVSTMVYGNKVAIIIREEPLKILSVEDSEIAQTYSSIFETLWQVL
ncbi:hypothetical protein J4417_02395 [Candidatus Woesearchaeota archaeon]|nr:hypothetical protein [Candidatus Woesearchaeota archaeon]